MIIGGGEILGNGPKIEITSLSFGKTHFDISHLNLLAKTGALAIPLSLRKVPIEKITPETMIDGSVKIGEGEKLEKLMIEARELTGLQLEEKLKKIMDLTRSTLKFFGKSAREELTNQASETEWLDQNVTAKSHYKATLAEALEHGYGICGHFTALYSLLAQQAGLEVVINHADGDMTPTNIIRSDNNQPLFKEISVGEKSNAHMFLEVLEKDRAIPVDPTTNLIGIEEGQLKMFQQAQYFDTLLGFTQLESEVEPPKSLFIILQTNIPAGNLIHTGILNIRNDRDINFAGNLSFNMSLINNWRARNGGLEILNTVR